MRWKYEYVGWFELPPKMKERLEPLFESDMTDDVVGGCIVFGERWFRRIGSLKDWFEDMKDANLITPEILDELAPYILAGNK